MTNTDLVGETFRVDCYDGSARYIVRSDNGDGTVNLEHIEDGYDNYAAPLIGEWCRIDAGNVRALLAQRERMQRMLRGGA
jgi:hypothetical protein